MEHENHELERRHVQKHLDTGRNPLLQKFAGQGPAEREGGTRVETTIARLRKKLDEQDDGRNEVPDERPVGSPGHAQRGYRAQTVNQHKVAGHVHNHAYKCRLHHDFRLADTAEEAWSRIAHQVDDATEHQNIEIRLLVFQLVGGQMFHAESHMPQRDRKVQKRYRNQGEVNRLHKDARAVGCFLGSQALGHHRSRVADGTSKEHRECKLHRPRAKRRIHLGRPKFREE